MQRDVRRRFAACVAQGMPPNLAAVESVKAATAAAKQPAHNLLLAEASCMHLTVHRPLPNCLVGSDPSRPHGEVG